MSNIYETVTTLIENREYEEAYKITCEEKYANDLDMIALKIKALRKMNLLTDAHKLARQRKFHDFIPIQIELIKVLIALKDIKQAIKRAKEERFKDNEDIQALLIKIYISGNCHKAITLASEERFHDNEKIQYLLITALQFSHQFEAAYTLASEERFKDNKPIQRKKRQIAKDIERHKRNNSKSNQELKKVIFAIKDKTITELEIEALELSTFQNKLLIIVFYYQNSYPLSVINVALKRLENEYQNNELALRTIKKFFEIVKQKHSFAKSLQFYDLLRQDLEQEKMSL